ncbi:MAG: segregation/condensation protein A [Candidatus Omnitrophota bacterium]|nr:segregation/condensation protein A [Candidatus Omnitrophota bacterium]MBU1894326.1 segregation/condensation protein A [Candidatus Omnitrophota bacterium]
MSYKIKLNIFEGPLDLLLFLIKREKIDIYDIPITIVTDQYLEYINLMKILDLEIAGDFLVMAATLMHIKSKMLLPPEESSVEPEEEEDPRDELVRKLLEYKKYKEAAGVLQEKYNQNKEIFLRKGITNKGKIISEDGSEYFEASLFDLITAFRKVLKSVPKATFHKVIKDRFTVSDKIHEIYHILSERPKMYFLELFKKVKNKDEIITFFLAILELMKMKEILVVQKSSFEEIEIIRNPELVKSVS